MSATERVLKFGYGHAVPDEVTTAWGCRMIVRQDGYTDFVYDRQDVFGGEFEPLQAWLNGGAMQDARDRASELLACGKMSTRREEHFTLHEDRVGVIVGNTNASAGYLYVAAWLKPCSV